MAKWRMVMLDSRACCLCRRRLRPWHRCRYLGMRCHAACLAEQLAWVDSQYPKIIERWEPRDG